MKKGIHEGIYKMLWFLFAYMTHNRALVQLLNNFDNLTPLTTLLPYILKGRPRNSSRVELVDSHLASSLDSAK